MPFYLLNIYAVNVGCSYQPATFEPSPQSCHISQDWNLEPREMRMRQCLNLSMQLKQN